MESESTPLSTNEVSSIILEQLNLILIYLDRPLVQIQVVALLIIIIIAIITELFARRRLDNILEKLAQNHTRTRTQQRIYRLLRTMRYGSFSIVGISGLIVTIVVFEYFGQPTSILRRVIPLFGLVLAYQIAIAFIYLRFRHSLIAPLHHYVFSPIAIFGLLYLTIGSFIDFNRIGDAIAFSLFGLGVTIEQLFWLVITAYVIFVSAKLIKQTSNELLENQRDQRSMAIASLLVVLRFAVIATGFLLMAVLLGIDASTLALIGGGLSVGIGIGLQNVVAQFVSGLTLIFEQSLRPGDVISINDKIGVVDSLNIRATTIRTNDNVAWIIPNDRFFTSEVVTYTKGGVLVRVAVPFRVSHKVRDLNALQKLVLDTAVQHPMVTDKATPFVNFDAINEYSLDFTLFVWMEQPQWQLGLRSDLYYLLWETFQKENIEIPFPQRDLNLRQGWEQMQPPAPPAPQPQPSPELGQKRDEG
jgi:potassium-dependent mechanosensitive channel